MYVRILGSAAGGGFPQWNCACALCAGVRAGAEGLRARTQTSAAVSADGERWFLLGCAPDVGVQLRAHPPLWPPTGRGSPVEGILLSSADVDATVGLFSLREGAPLTVLGTAGVLEDVLSRNALAATLRRTPAQLQACALALGEERLLRDRRGAPAGLGAVAFPVAGKVPPHLAGRASRPEDTIGLLVRDLASGGRLAFVPCAGAIDAPLLAALEGADVVLFDGTFWSEDELAAVSPGAPSASAMGHLAIDGPGGSLAALAGLGARLRLFVHVNNTNPVLREHGPERGRVRASGWEVAHDGMELRA